MTDLPPSPVLPDRPRSASLWKPIGLTLAASVVLSISTCAGGFVFGRGIRGLSGLLISAGLLFLLVFVATLIFAAVYFVFRMVRKDPPR